MSNSAVINPGETISIKARPSTWYYINCIISISIMLFFRYIPAPAPMTPLGITVLGIFIGAIYGWCTTNMIWPSCVALTLLGFTSYTTVGKAWTSGWGNSLVIFAFFLMIIAALLQESGLTNYLANWAISRKFTAGRPWVLISLIFIIATFAASVVGQIPIVIVFWYLCQSICEELGYKKGDKLPALLCFGIVFVTTIGNVALPFQIAVVSNFGFLIASSGGAIKSYDFLAYFLYSLAMVAIIISSFILMCKYIIRPDVTLLANYKPKEGISDSKIDEKQKISIIITIILVAVLMAPSFLPKTSYLGTIFNKLGTTGTAALVLGLVALLKYKGKPFVDVGNLIHKGVIWGLLFMLATAFTIAGAINSETTGIIPWFAQLCGPILNSGGVYVFLFAFFLITLISTNFINNVVISSVMIPLSYSFCISMGINPLALVALFVYFVDFAIMLPSASPAGGLMHNSNEWISKNEIYRWGFITLLMQFVLALVLGWPLANIFF